MLSDEVLVGGVSITSFSFVFFSFGLLPSSVTNFKVSSEAVSWPVHTEDVYTAVPFLKLTVFLQVNTCLVEKSSPGTFTFGSTLVSNDPADDTEAIEAIENDMMLKSANLDKFIISLQEIY